MRRCSGYSAVTRVQFAHRTKSIRINGSGHMLQGGCAIDEEQEQEQEQEEEEEQQQQQEQKNGQFKSLQPSDI